MWSRNSATGEEACRRRRIASLKAAVYEQIARLGQAASSPSRLELLDLLSQGPRTVDALAQQTRQSVATTSHHLQVLRRARLVEAEKSGLYVTYRLADPQIETFLLALRHLAEARLAEIQQITRTFLESRRALEPLDNEELARRVRSGDVTVIDVRPREEYAAAHIPGARGPVHPAGDEHPPHPGRPPLTTTDSCMEWSVAERAAAAMNAARAKNAEALSMTVVSAARCSLVRERSMSQNDRRRRFIAVAVDS